MDAFLQDWNHLHPYALPPFLLVRRTLQKVRSERVNRTLVIALAWSGQPRFPLLLEMIIDQPCNLSPTVQEPAAKPTEDNSTTTGRELTTLSHVASVRNSLYTKIRNFSAADIICPSWRKSREHRIPLHGSSGVVGVKNRVRSFFSLCSRNCQLFDIPIQ